MMSCVVKLCTLSALQQPDTSSSPYFQTKENDICISLSSSAKLF